jgi:hypothetical protein
MVQINLVKKMNSAVLLADGFEIGNSQSLSTYKDLSGLLGNLLSAIRSHRTEWLTAPENKNKLIPRYPPAAMESLVESATGRQMGKKSKSSEDSRGEDDEKKEDVFRGSTGLEDMTVC